VSVPDLSVVIVTHGAWEWTERALAALGEHTRIDHEVIVVDNASTDGTREGLVEAAADSILLDRNVGFASGSNLGARRAMGRHLCFLNSDALVTAGWLEPLREALDAGAGAAGPRVLYPGGELQEAGSLIGRDGGTAPYGEGEDAAAPPYRFPRQADYVSAVCLLIARRTFWEAGGFDPGYRLAYYEDSDLCLTLAERGLPVRYVPSSVVVHAKRASGSEATAQALSDENRGRFMERWAHRLTGRPRLRWPPWERAQVGARDALASERLLLVRERLPDAGDQLLASLAEGLPRARVTAVAAAGDPQPLLERGVEATGDLEEAEGWLRARPGHYDAVITERGALSLFSAALDEGQPWAPRVLDPPAEPGELARALAPAGVALGFSA